MNENAVSSTFLWHSNTSICVCVSRVCVGMWQVGVVAETDTYTLWQTPAHRRLHAPDLLFPPFSSHCTAYSPIPFILSCSINRMQGGSEVKTCLNLFSVKQKLVVSEKSTMICFVEPKKKTGVNSAFHVVTKSAN